MRPEPRSGTDPDFRGLNDVVIRAAPFFHLVEIGLSIDGESVMTYRGDGLILATPVGSTAHSLSAGGPILPPNAHMFVVTPICPHTLTQRPLVDSAHKVYEVKPLGEGIATVLVIDGQVQVPLRCGDRVTIRRGRPRSRWSACRAIASTAPSATSSAGVRSRAREAVCSRDAVWIRSNDPRRTAIEQGEFQPGKQGRAIGLMLLDDDLARPLWTILVDGHDGLETVDNPVLDDPGLPVLAALFLIITTPIPS